MTCGQSLRLTAGLQWRRATLVWALVSVGGCQQATEPKVQGQTEEQFAQLLARYPEANLTVGRRVFMKQCSVCHQATGIGTSKAIPPLRGHIANLSAHPLGRTYLARLVPFGLNGPIAVNGQKYFNAMPPLGALLSNDELAAAVNYALVSWGSDASIAPSELLQAADLAAQRQVRRSSSQTLALRKELWPDGVPPRAAAPQGQPQ